MSEYGNWEHFEQQFTDPEVLELGKLVGVDPEDLDEEAFDRWVQVQEDGWKEGVRRIIEDHQTPPDDMK